MDVEVAGRYGCFILTRARHMPFSCLIEAAENDGGLDSVSAADVAAVMLGSLTPARFSACNPMWGAVSRRVDENSLDGLLNGGAAAHMNGEADAPPPPPSPFSELFPAKLLRDNGVQLESVAGTSRAPRDAVERVPKGGIARRRRLNGTKEHFCAQCNSGFTRRHTLNKHVREKHAAPPAPLRTCTFAGCHFATRTPNLMTLHRRSHLLRISAAAPEYFCRSCSTRYAHRRSLLQHITKQHGSDAALIGKDLADAPPAVQTAPPAASPAASSSSGRTPTRSSSRAIAQTSRVVPPHSLADQPVRKTYRCDRCKYTSQTFRALFAHKKRQHSNKEAVICVYCRHHFQTSDRLMAHVKKVHLSKRTDNRSQLLTCPNCDFSTTTRRVFTAHCKGCKASSTAPPPTDQAVATTKRTSLELPYAPESSSEIYDCVAHLQRANMSLLDMLKRRDQELYGLRQNVAQLLLKLSSASALNANGAKLDKIDAQIDVRLSELIVQQNSAAL